MRDRLVVDVQEGPRTVLERVRTEGGSGLEEAPLAEALAEGLGGPYSPALALRLASLVEEA